jgi:hypothetical protein
MGTCIHAYISYTADHVRPPSRIQLKLQVASHPQCETPAGTNTNLGLAPSACAESAACCAMRCLRARQPGLRMRQRVDSIGLSEVHVQSSQATACIAAPAQQVAASGGWRGGLAALQPAAQTSTPAGQQVLMRQAAPLSQHLFLCIMTGRCTSLAYMCHEHHGWADLASYFVSETLAAFESSLHFPGCWYNMATLWPFIESILPYQRL